MNHDVKVAVVTGAGSGLGRALARALHSKGVAVVVADVVEARAQEVAAELGSGAVPFTVDVRDADAMAALLAFAIDALGPVDLWVNNAGVAVAGLVGDVPLEDWHWVVDVNLWGVVHGCHVAVPYLKGRGGGAVLNVASAAGLVATGGMAPYNITKTAVVSLSETLYSELKGTGVSVTVLCPTFFETRLLEDARTTNPVLTKVAAKLMKRAFVQADQVAERALADVASGRLHSVPMMDGRVMWAVRRALPQRFYDMVPKLMSLLERVAR